LARLSPTKFGAGRGWCTTPTLTVSDTVERYATKVPGAGDWAMTRTHVPLLLPEPWVLKKS